jgi:putative transcriptional regulator
MVPSLLRAMFIACALLAGSVALAQPVMLVASPKLTHPVYGRTVVVAASFGAQQHVGFIVNRPLEKKLGDVFPHHGPSRKVGKAVFFGGPAHIDGIFALVAGEKAPGGGCIAISPGLFAVIHRHTLDRVIEANPERARYFAGIVTWRPGELRRELAAGIWYAMPVDAGLALRDPRGLWEELVARRPGPGMRAARWP